MSKGLFKDILLGLIVVGYLVIGVSLAFVSTEWRDAGIWAGRGAIVLLWITALPGIFRRFQVQGWLKQVQLFLLPIRRRIGILVFILATMHYLWVRVFGIIMFGPPNISQVPVFETIGLLAFLLLFSLFITSNNISVKFLKKNWQRLHYLVYPALWLLILHITLQPPFDFNLFGVGINLENLIYFGLPTLTIALLQIISWFYIYKKRQERKSNPNT